MTDSRGQGGAQEDQSCTAVHQGQEEELVVVESDIVGNPRTVMIHLQYTATAIAAVMAPVRLEKRALMAVAGATIAFSFCNQAGVWLPPPFISFGDPARICGISHVEAPRNHSSTNVGDEAMQCANSNCSTISVLRRDVELEHRQEVIQHIHCI